MPRQTKNVILLALAGLLTLLAGCGKKTVDVKGTVSYLGKPLPLASIVFVDANGRTASGEINEGAFSVSGVPVGDRITVIISTTSIQNQIERREAAHRPPPGEEWEPIPPEVLQLPESELPPEMKQRIKRLRGMNPRMKERVEKRKQMLVPIPPRYESPDTTPLTFTITSSTRDLAITLEQELPSP